MTFKKASFYDMAEIALNTTQVYIIPHENPDGDALGSSFALCEFIRSLGKKADVVTDKPIPENYRFMEIESILPENATENRDVFVLDCGDSSRMSTRQEIYDRAKNKYVIDHHMTNKGFGDYCLVQGGYSSTGEIIYNIIKEAEKKENKSFLNDRIAFFIYTAIISDTGGLKYSSTTQNTFLAVAELSTHNVDIAYVNRMLFDSNPLRKIKLQALVMSTLNILCDSKLAFVYSTIDMMKKAGALENDTEGFVNIPRSIEGVEVAIYFKEKKDKEIKVSMRSNTYADVSKISTILNGGGHFHASGFTVNECLEDAIKKVIGLTYDIL